MAIAVVILAVAGCGSSGSNDSSASALQATTTKAQFLKKAKTICARGTDEMNKLDVAAWKKYDPSEKNATEAIKDKVALALLPAREREVRRLRALGLPKGSARYVDKMLTAWEQGAEEGRKHPRRLRGAGYEFAFYEAYTMGIDYGLESCWLG